MLTIKQATLFSIASFPLLSIMPAQAQFGAPKVAAVTAAARPAAVARGGHGMLFVTLSVRPQFHINAHQPNDPAYIPTNFQGQPVSGITFGPAHYPVARTVKVSYSSKPLLVYMGKAVLAIPFSVSKTAKPGKTVLAGTVSFQGCDAKSCYPPASAQLRATVLIK